MTIQRWHWVYEHRKCVPFKDDDGRYVLFADHQQALSTAQTRIAELEEALAVVKEEFATGSDLYIMLEQTLKEPSCPTS